MQEVQGVQVTHGAVNPTLPLFKTESGCSQGHKQRADGSPSLFFITPLSTLLQPVLCQKKTVNSE